MVLRRVFSWWRDAFDYCGLVVSIEKRRVFRDWLRVATSDGCAIALSGWKNGKLRGISRKENIRKKARRNAVLSNSGAFLSCRREYFIVFLR